MKPLHIALVLALLVIGVVVLWRFVPSAPVSTELPVTAESARPDSSPTASELLDAPREVDRTEVRMTTSDATADANGVDTSNLPDVTKQPVDDAPKSVVIGIVTDETTREPLPEYSLRVRDASGRSEQVITDKDGRFATSAALQLGTLSIRLIDTPGNRRDIRDLERPHPGNATTPLAIEALVGPTFTLAFEPPSAAERDLSARLNYTRQSRSTEYVSVRRGGSRWVRLPFLGDVNANDELALEVRSDDGLWRGSAIVVRAQGVERGVVLVHGAPCAVVRGRVVDDKNEPIERALVTLDLGGTERSARRTGLTQGDGTFRFDYLPAAAATIAVEAFRFAPHAARPVAVEAGKETVEEIVLALVPSAGSIRGRITSETGRFDGSVTMQLSATSPNVSRAGGPARVEVEWVEEDGRKVGRFAFPDVPAGGYRVSGAVDGEWYHVKPEWEPRSVLVTPPNESVSFVLRDGGARTNLVFRVTATDTGEPVDSFRTRIAIPPRSERMRLMSPGDVAVANALYTSKVYWCVMKAGYQPVVGDESAFSLETKCDDAPCRVAEIVLRPGWGDEFEVTSSESGKPLAGVKVYADGAEVGTSDARGRVLVTGSVAPRELRFAYADWRASRVLIEREIDYLFSEVNSVRMSPPKPKK